MLRHERMREMRDLERMLERAIRNFNDDFPHKTYCKEQILFEFDIDNLKILQPMDVTKKVSTFPFSFTGSLVFKDAEGDVLDVSKGTNLQLTADNAAVGSVSLSTNPDGTPSSKFAGQILALGKLTLTAVITNDQGQQITGTGSITAVGDSTITGVDVNID